MVAAGNLVQQSYGSGGGVVSAQSEQFVEDASHELKTPIAIMEGHLSMLERWGKSDPAVLDESLRTSLEQILRLKGIMQELLDLTRAESVGPLQEVQPLSVHDVIPKTVEGFAAVHPDFSFRQEVSGLTGVKVRIEKRHLEQLLLILLDNAVNYSAERKRIGVIGEVQDGNVQIGIQDQGIGIGEEHIPRLFDRFYRADKARSREQGGTGLGLSIAKRLAENYAGTIWIMSKPGKGRPSAYPCRSIPRNDIVFTKSTYLLKRPLMID
ncbi:HAMP domain-containing histidine kinase [Paenibacillus sp. P25]|nr:HAMP domain-containing histidine kinase [Paenibacillus sp. P25]